MSNRSSGGKLEGFFTGKGFYIVLFLCAAVIGVSAWMMAAGNETMADNATTSAAVTDNRRVETIIVPALDNDTEPVMAEENPIKLEPPRINTDGIAEAEAVDEAELVPASAKVYVWPVVGEIERSCNLDTLSYDVTLHDWRTHAGVDIAAPLGTAVNAAHSGIVESIFEDDFYGTVVCIAHGDGTSSFYANLAATPTVTVGSRIEAGQTIGSVGATALCEVGQGTHLHYAVMIDGAWVDPMNYLPA